MLRLDSEKTLEADGVRITLRSVWEIDGLPLGSDFDAAQASIERLQASQTTLLNVAADSARPELTSLLNDR